VWIAAWISWQLSAVVINLKHSVSCYANDQMVHRSWSPAQSDQWIVQTANCLIAQNNYDGTLLNVIILACRVCYYSKTILTSVATALMSLQSYACMICDLQQPHSISAASGHLHQPDSKPQFDRYIFCGKFVCCCCHSCVFTCLPVQ